MPATLTIGHFSQITHLSIKTLRRYHEAGLLEPAHVDPQTGYRYYAVDQIPTAQVISRFRELGMPVREVGAVLTTADPDARAALIGHHLDRLEGQLAQTRAAVASLRRLLRPDPPPVDVELVRRGALTVAAITATVGRSAVLAWWRDAMGDLDRALRAEGSPAAGPPGGLYDNELFTDERGAAVVYIPAHDPPTTGRIRPLQVAGADLAVTVHHGPHDDIDVSYGLLGGWVARHALAIAGPVRETYLVGPLDTEDMTRWSTEIGWPVFRTSNQ